MIALFADTFYWIALADVADSAHQRALTLTAARIDSPIVTTDEVLVEYLTFFATAPEPMRRQALTNASVFSKIPVSVSSHRAEGRFCLAWLSTKRVPTRGTAWSIVFRCRRYARKG
jgi:uncharacterized protein